MKALSSRNPMQAWLLDNIRPIKPVQVRGALGLFDAPVKMDDLEYL